ncbi:MAG: hypothetical protein RR356_03260 [Bacteroidales bacterium]
MEEQFTQQEEPISIGNWMITILLMSIPMVNIIMLFVWAFGDYPKTKSNWAKASLIWMAIGIILVAIFWSTFFGAFMAMGN